MPSSTAPPDLKFAANLRKSPCRRGTHRPCILQAALVALFRRQMLNQTGHQRRPARLVVRAQALSRVPVEILMEPHQLPPMRIVYKPRLHAQRRPSSTTVRQNKVLSRHDSSSAIWAGFNRRPLPVGNLIVNASP